MGYARRRIALGREEAPKESPREGLDMFSQSLKRLIRKVVKHETSHFHEVPHARLVCDPPHPIRIGLPKNLCGGHRELLGEVVRPDLQQHSLSAVVYITPAVANPGAEKETQLLRGLTVEYSLARKRGCLRQCPQSDRVS